MAKRKKEIKVKEPVRIREKVLGDGTISLYLDMYHKGNRKKEWLKLYIIPDTTPAAKQQNKNTRRLAEQIKAQRILDIQKDGLVDWEKLKKSRTTLVFWLEDFVTCEAQLSPSGVISKRNAKGRVEEYLASIGKPDLRLSEVDREFCRDFVAFLRTCKSHRGKEKISETTARLLMYRIAAAMDKAVIEGLIPNNPFRALEAKEKPKNRAFRREFLTVEELKVLINTPCRFDIVKRARWPTADASTSGPNTSANSSIPGSSGTRSSIPSGTASPSTTTSPSARSISTPSPMTSRRRSWTTS